MLPMVLAVSNHLGLFLNGLGATTEPAAIFDAVHAITSPSGLNIYAAWRIPVFKTDVETFKIGQNVFPHSSVPPAFWLDYWPAAKDHGSSPMSQYALLQRKPMTMTETMRVLALTEKERWLVNLYHKHDMRDLLYCPVGRWMIGLWSGKVLRLNWQARATVFELAIYAAIRLDELVTKKLDSKIPPLSAREVTILRLASRGMRALAIADSLGISDETVRHHLKRVTKKLGAKSPMHAACQALRLHLIS